MKKKLFFFALAVLCSCSTRAYSQSEALKFEVGAQFTLMKGRNLLTTDHETDYGVGGRLSFNINKHVALEGEMNFFPKSNSSAILNKSVLISGSRIQGLFGVKAGIHSDKIGIFGKVRPGFLHRGATDTRDPFFPGTSPRFLGTTHFATDIGGVIEVYPSRRAILRFDIGDTIIRSPLTTNHTLQISTGLGFRF